MSPGLNREQRAALESIPADLRRELDNAIADLTSAPAQPSRAAAVKRLKNAVKSLTRYRLYSDRS